MSTAKQSPSLHVKIPAPSILPPAPTSSSSTITVSQFSSASTPPTASTPTSGMHSPPLSATIHENVDSEMTLAVPPPTTTSAATLTTAPPSTVVAPAGASHDLQTNDAAERTSGSEGSSSHNTALSSAEIPLTTTTAVQPTGAVERVAIPTSSASEASASVAATSKAESSLPVLVKGESEMSTNNSDINSSAMDEDLSSTASNASSLSDDGKTEDPQKLQRHQNKQLAIEHVIRKGKILKVSRRLRTRLEYAILKIRRGWSKYTLQEVESLIQPACSPIIAGRKLHSTASAHNSPRQAERKRIRKLYPSYEETSVHHPHHQRSSSDPAQMDMDESMNQAYASYRARLPSFSQYKDLELFLPAKSLMEIATSKPEPGYVSPYQRSPNLQSTQYLHSGDRSAHSSRHATPEPLYRDATPSKEAVQSPGRWSTYSSPTTTSAAAFEDEEQSENGVPSAAQAARTILMLSSPTRPPPRTLNQSYIFDMHAGSPTTSPLGGEWTAPYSPMTSSPLVQFQTNASSSPSPDRSPSQTHQSSVEAERASSNASTPRGSPYSNGGSRTMKQSYSGLYGTGHEPASPSPLSTSLFPSSHESRTSHSRSSSPTLKRAARFAAAATLDSKESRADYNSTADQVYPEWQQARDDKQDPSMDVPYQTSSSSSSSAHFSNQNYGARTPPHQMVSSPRSSYSQQHGMRTPPPSGGKELGHALYSSGMHRRDSGMLAPPGTEMDLTKLLRAGGPAGSHHGSRQGSATASPSHGSPSSSPYHHRS